MDATPAHSRAPDAAGEAHGASHPGPAVYFKIGLVLFILTALEVGVYELAHRGGGVQAVLKPILVPVLLVLSAMKFALVAMYYMHLKQDSKLFSSVFVFPIIIAAVIIVSLIALFAYHFAYQRGVL